MDERYTSRKLLKCIEIFVMLHVNDNVIKTVYLKILHIWFILNVDLFMQ